MGAQRTVQAQSIPALVRNLDEGKQLFLVGSQGGLSRISDNQVNSWGLYIPLETEHGKLEFHHLAEVRVEEK